MAKGNVGDWYEDDCIGGFIREDGTIDVCLEKNLTDEDTDKYAVEVQNGEGYYDSNGRYKGYGKEEYLSDEYYFDNDYN